MGRCVNSSKQLSASAPKHTVTGHNDRQLSYSDRVAPSLALSDMDGWMEEWTVLFENMPSRSKGDGCRVLTTANDLALPYELFEVRSRC